MAPKVTFPHMGTLYIPVKALLEQLGLEVVTPPPCSKRTVTLGTQHAPEFACLPLKINLGNYREALELGAEVILMAGGSGPCRFGYYAQVERDILRDLGLQFEMLVLEPPQGHLGELFAQVKRLVPCFTWSKLWHALRIAWAKILVIDEVERILQGVRASEAATGGADDVFQGFLNNLDAATDFRSIEKAHSEAVAQLSAVPQAADRPLLQIGVVGEIYTVLEPFVNLDTERRLGAMGVRVVRNLFLGDWIREHLFRFKVKAERAKLVDLAGPFLGGFVGGHGLETVAHSVEFARRGIDGVLQLAPLTCMPEIVAETVLPDVSERHGIPILTVFLDEHTGEAGLLTRLEAFVDLLAARRVQRPATGVADPLPMGKRG